MKMHYHQKRNSHFSFGKIGTALILAVILIILGTVINISSLTYKISRPIMYGVSRVGDGVSYSLGLLRYGDDYDAVLLAKNYAESLEQIRLQNELLKSENDMFRREMGLRSSSEKDDVFAAVLSHPPLTPFDTLVVEIGDEDSVSEGDKVFAGENTYIGTVKSVKGSIAIVELISTADRKTEGILVRTEMAIVIDGIGGGAFEFIAPESFDVEVGDLVVTPGSSRFAIGRVVEKKSESSGSFVNVLLEQIVNLRRLQWVRIDTK